MKTTEEQLKVLARKFLQAELWEDLTDADVFGVELEDGLIAYCCVMGSSGIHKGLGIYVGKRGFRSYLDTINKEHANDRKMLFDRMATFEAMQVSFDDSGNVQWWTHHPNMVPSPENSTEEEMAVMCRCLEACNGLRKLIDAEEGDVVSIGFDEFEEYPTKEGGKDAPLISIDGSSHSLVIRPLPAYDTSDEEQLLQLADKVVDSGTFRADLSLLQGLRKAGTLQCRLIHPPTPVKEDGDAAGFYPVWLLTVNKGDGRIVPTDIVHRTDEEGVYKILANLCAAMYQQGHQPLQISVPNEATENLLKAFCHRQGIKLVKERLPLRELDQAWQGVFSHFDGDGNADVMLN